MALLLGKELGLERIAREVIVLLRANLNTALTTEDAKWSADDQALAALLEQPFVECVSNKVQPANFHVGHKPSLVEADIEGYPNVAAMAYQSFPSADQGDHYEGHQISCFIEAMVIDGPYDQKTTGFERLGEDLVNRKSQRMVEAIHNVIVSNRTLGGYVFEIGSPPRAQVSECFRRRAGKGHGQDYYWQMIRLEYTVNKVAAY